MIKNQIKEVDRLPFSRLLKSEVAQFTNRLIAIVGSHNPEVLLIEPVFNLLKAQIQNVNILNIRYGVDPTRLELKPLREHMVLQTSAIKLRLRMLSKLSNDNELKIIKTAVDGHLLYLNASRNDKELDSRIYGFIDKVSTDTEFANALEKHDFIPLINKLDIAMDEVQMVESKRVKLLSQRPETRTSLIIKEIANAVENLFKDIEVSQLRNPELDYAPLVNEVNRLINQFRVSLNIRDAANKRKAENENGDTTKDESENEVLDILTNAAPHGYNLAEMESSASQNGNSYHSSELFKNSIKKMNNLLPEQVNNGSDEKHFIDIDNKKAVATTANHLQQPNVNN